MILLSHILNEQTPLYGGARDLHFRPAKSIAAGDSSNTMTWTLTNHAGTHMDAPRHFVEKGASVTDFAAEDWMFGKVVLKDIAPVAAGHLIGPGDLGDLEDGDLLLIRSGFERHRGEDLYWKDSPGLHKDLAPALKERMPSLRAVGMDFISVSNINNREMGRVAHRAFLGAGILLIEDMKLSPLTAAPEKVLVAPVMVEGADGSPCTVFAWNE